MCSRTCPTTAASTRRVWRPDPGTPTTAEPKPTKWRVGWRVEIPLHRGWRESCSKAGRSAVLRHRRGRWQGGWKYRTSSCACQVICRGHTVIWWLCHRSLRWLFCEYNYNVLFDITSFLFH